MSLLLSLISRVKETPESLYKNKSTLTKKNEHMDTNITFNIETKGMTVFSTTYIFFRGVRGDTPRIRCELISLFVLCPDYRDGSI
jgi:hypothetical protein